MTCPHLGQRTPQGTAGQTPAGPSAPSAPAPMTAAAGPGSSAPAQSQPAAVLKGAPAVQPYGQDALNAAPRTYKRIVNGREAYALLLEVQSPPAVRTNMLAKLPAQR